MNKILTFIKNSKGLYRIAFTLCAVLLSVITVLITSTNESERISVSEDIQTMVKTDDESSADSSCIELYDSKVNKENINILDNTENKKTDVYADQSFAPPVNGKIIKEFSVNKLLYNKTMDDWRIHTGIDISAELGSKVLASQDGRVDFIGYDINMGYFLRIVNNEFECTYMSLSSDITVNEGDKVTRGQHIGFVSDSAVQELCDEPHIHFEIKKDGKIVNPSDYIY